MAVAKKFSWLTVLAVIGGIASSQILQLLFGRDGLIGIFVFCSVAGVGFWLGRRSAFKETAKKNQQCTVRKTTIQHTVNNLDEKGDHIGKTYAQDIATGDFLNKDGTRMDYIDRLRAGLES